MKSIVNEEAVLRQLRRIQESRNRLPPKQHQLVSAIIERHFEGTGRKFDNDDAVSATRPNVEYRSENWKAVEAARGAARQLKLEAKGRLQRYYSEEGRRDEIVISLAEDGFGVRIEVGTATNLPQPLTSFVGRATEVSEARRLLATSRLVTLFGLGGIGKTRLSIQLAEAALPNYPDGVWLVELAPLVNEHLVAQAVASVLGVQEQAGQSLRQSLVEFVKDRRMLLVVDNCEHLHIASARLIKDLLQHGQHLRIIATSREPLGITGESAYRVPPLSVPDPQTKLSVAQLAEVAAVRLFVERATDAQSTFRLSDANVSTVTEICRCLDGIPLALELAAVRVRALSLATIAAKLSARFELLTGGDPTTLPRQQTLRGCIDWSYELLAEREGILLQRLSVFAGGWTLEAAEAITADPKLPANEVAGHMIKLVEKSVVAMDHEGGRYRLLETVRQYARDRLHEAEVTGSIQQRHRDHFLAMAEQAEPELAGAGQAEWLGRLDRDYENLRGALEWSARDVGSAAGLRFCGALFRFWCARGYLSEGREWCGRFLENRGDDRSFERAKALNAAGNLAFMQGEFASARELHETCLALRRFNDDRTGIAASLNNLGLVADQLGDRALAKALAEESLGIHRELRNLNEIAICLLNLGVLEYEQGAFAVARVRFEESLAISRQVESQGGIARALANLGSVAIWMGDYTEAEKFHLEDLAIQRALGDELGIATCQINLGAVAYMQQRLETACELLKEGLKTVRRVGDTWGIAVALEQLAPTVAALGSALEAAMYWGAAERLREKIGSQLVPCERVRHDERIRKARAGHADDAAFDAAWLQGRAMSIHKMVDRALSHAPG